jgi:hypothetical protein
MENVEMSDLDVRKFLKDKHAVALDIQGWKIMAKDGNIRWPFESRSGYPRPEWCIEQSYRAGQGQDSWLKGMSEDKRLEWAADVLSEMTDHAALLDSQGWKIVNRDDPNQRWPYGADDLRYACPDWCEDLRPVNDPATAIMPTQEN